MKTVLVFANPFGYGPSGKALSIANYLSKKLVETQVIVCGSGHLLKIAGNLFKTLAVNERDENEIVDLISQIKGEKFLFSSQNRFAIKAAKKVEAQSAFLDGLAWFWKEIPEDHFLAERIFWINYPGVKDKIPASLNEKISLVEGISENFGSAKRHKREKLTVYIGGCKNPLTHLPFSYLDLVATLLIETNEYLPSVLIATDSDSKEYLKSHFPQLSKKIKLLTHEKFLEQVLSSKMLITNGGQTAAMEAANFETSLVFILPCNLSQIALINKIRQYDETYPAMTWNNYCVMPDNLMDLTEKEAIELIDNTAKKLLKNKRRLAIVSGDFKKLLAHQQPIPTPKIFKSIGQNGVFDVCQVLINDWKLK